MIEKLDYSNQTFKDCFTYNMGLKLNEVIDYLNQQEELNRLKKVQEMLDIVEPKWKLGDEFWYITKHFNGIANGFIDTNSNLCINTNSNIFRTREQAEQVLAEIKQVLEKYQ